jgi:DNA polymerase III gamma/tau subunit
MKSFGLINMGILPLLLEAMTPAYAQHDQREQESRRPNQEQEAKPARQQPPPNPERQQPPPQPVRQQPPPAPKKQPAQPRPERPPPQSKPAGQAEPRHPQKPTYSGHPQSANPARPEEQERARGQQQQQKQQQAAKAQQEQKQRPQNLKGQQEQKPIREQPHQQQAHRPAQQVQRDYENQHKGAWLDHRAHNWQAEHHSWEQRGGYKGYRIPDARYRSSFGPSHSFRMFSFPLMVVSGFPRFQYGGLWFSVMDPWPEYWSDNWYGNDEVYVEFYGGGYYLRNRMHPMDRIALSVYVS